MKKRSVSCLEVKINLDYREIYKIYFIFKQEKDEDAPTLALKKYIANDKVNSDVVCDEVNNIFYIPFTVADTENFKSGKYFYMDTRIKLMDDPEDPFDDYNSIPETDIVSLKMNPTLFSSIDLYRLDGDE